MPCKRATELIERRNEVKLSFKSALQLKMHLLLCEACSTYEKQSLLLHQAIRKHFGSEALEKQSKEVLKEKIISKLE